LLEWIAPTVVPPTTSRQGELAPVELHGMLDDGVTSPVFQHRP
jgi:hypothetical protein